MTNTSYFLTNVYEILTWLVNRIFKYKKVEVRVCNLILCNLQQLHYKVNSLLNHTKFNSSHIFITIANSILLLISNKLSLSIIYYTYNSSFSTDIEKKDVDVLKSSFLKNLSFNKLIVLINFWLIVRVTSLKYAMMRICWENEKNTRFCMIFTLFWNIFYWTWHKYYR